MKKRIIVAGLILASTVVMGQEGSMCGVYFDAVSRGVNNMQQQGSNLSNIAKNKLYQDLKFDTEQCITNCEGEHFSLCNDVAKKVEKHSL